tara:strand:+ start:78 stop:278 length:201 start_codon:yes stop_codon:yes gene_type:complete
MKQVAFLFILSFLFYVIGQILWMIAIISDTPFFGYQVLEDLIMYFPFTICGVLGLLGSYKWYKITR